MFSEYLKVNSEVSMLSSFWSLTPKTDKNGGFSNIIYEQICMKIKSLFAPLF